MVNRLSYSNQKIPIFSTKSTRKPTVLFYLLYLDLFADVVINGKNSDGRRQTH